MAEKQQRGLAEMWQLAAPKTKRKKEESEKEQQAMAAKFSVWMMKMKDLTVKQMIAGGRMMMQEDAGDYF